MSETSWDAFLVGEYDIAQVGLPILHTLPSPTNDIDSSDIDYTSSSEPDIYMGTPDTSHSQPEPTGEWIILFLDAELTRYHFVKKLGEGNQSVVHLLRRLSDDKLVVRKFCPVPITFRRAQRDDREIKMARRIYQELTDNPPSGGEILRFTTLLSSQNLPCRQQRGSWYRESFWRFCDGGGTLRDLVSFFGHNNHHLPDALVLGLMIPVLSAINWMNQNKIHHLDLHSDNCFLEFTHHAASHEEGLEVVVGDFGFSRLQPPLEEPMVDPALWHDPDMHPMDLADLSKPLSGISAHPDRLPSDVDQFTCHLETVLRMHGWDETDPAHQPLSRFLQSLRAIGDQDSIDRVLPEDVRPPIPDLEPKIAEARVLQAQLLLAAGEDAIPRALSIWRAKVSTNSTSSNTNTNTNNSTGHLPIPRVFPTKETAFEAARVEIGIHRGPFAVVNLLDKDSVEQGAAGLACEREAWDIAMAMVGEIS